MQWIAKPTQRAIKAPLDHARINDRLASVRGELETKPVSFADEDHAVQDWLNAERETNAMWKALAEAPCAHHLHTDEET